MAGNFLPVWVIEDNRQILALEHFIIVLRLVNPEANALVLNELPRPIKGAVGEENRLGAGPLILSLPIIPEITGARQLLAVVSGTKQIAAVPIGFHRKKAVFIRGQGRVSHTIALVIQMPNSHLYISQRFARIGGENKTLQVA